MRRWTIHDRRPDSAALEEIAELIAAEKVVVLPTDTIYGLHGIATSDRAVETIRSAKRRRDDQPFVVLCSDIGQVLALGASPGPGVLDALERLWPAPLTAILPLERPIAASAGNPSLAIRIPDLEWLRQLVHMTGPLASTSTNLSGEPPATRPSEIPGEVLERVAGMVDAGTLDGQPSTLVQFTESSPRLLRDGAFTFTQKLWKTVWKSL